MIPGSYKMMRSKLIYFFVILANLEFSRSSNKYGYVFEEETVSYITDTLTKRDPRLDVLKNPFRKLGPRDLWNLCMAAKNYASLDGMDSPDHFNFSTNQADQYIIGFLNRKRETHLLLPCPTLPGIFLRDGNSNNEIKIVTRMNTFMDERYIFGVEIIQSISQASKEVPSEYFALFYRAELYNLCVAAKKRILHPVVMLSNDVGRFRRYSVLYPNETEKFQDAFDCPTTPKMYLRLGDLGNEFTVMLVQTDSK